MAKEKILSKVSQSTKKGMNIDRTNYEYHTEFSVKFRFGSGDNLTIEIVPKDHVSELRIIWNKNKPGSVIIDEVRYHLDPMSIFNSLGIIKNHDDGKKTLNGLMIIYKSEEKEFENHFDRIAVVDEANVSKDKKIYLYDRYDNVPESVFGVIPYEGLKGEFSEDRIKLVKKALNEVYGLNKESE